MSQLRIGMADKDAIALMRPVSRDWGRAYLGGSGASALFFQVSSTQQIALSVSGAPTFAVERIGIPQPKSTWTHYAGDSITVE
jgi:hypothetical protein